MGGRLPDLAEPTLSEAAAEAVAGERLDVGLQAYRELHGHAIKNFSFRGHP